MAKKGSDTKLVAGPSEEKMVSKASMVKMKVSREFLLKGKDGKEYAGHADDVVEVPEDVAQQLEHKFLGSYVHSGTMDTKTAQKAVIQRAQRI